MKLLFSVTAKDFEIQTFSVGGHGGGGKDTSNSGVRLIHTASGARGEGREHRTNGQNRKSAFMKLVQTDQFKKWHKIECARRMGQQPVPIETDDELRDRVNKQFDADMAAGKIKVEYL